MAVFRVERNKGYTVNLHSAIFSLAAYTVILCFSLFKSGALAKSIFSAH